MTNTDRTLNVQTAPTPRLPDFFIIGSAKSGTTSMYNLLLRHPDIFMPERKELEFFARDDVFETGLNAYARHFVDAAPDQIVGEGSTIYSLAPLFPDTAERLARHVPGAKLVYVMRQPVLRAYSFYVQILKNYQNVTGDLNVHRTFEEFIDPAKAKTAAPRNKVFSPANDHLPDTPELCLAGGDYVYQIEKWLAHFPREQILFLKFEDFVSDRPATMRKMTDFLGAAPLAQEVFDAQGVTRNVAANHFKRRGQERAVHQLRSKMGALWALRQVLPAGLRNGLRARLTSKGANDTRHIPPKMEDATRAQLIARYKPQTEKLSQITGLDFSDWWDDA